MPYVVYHNKNNGVYEAYGAANPNRENRPAWEVVSDQGVAGAVAAIAKYEASGAAGTTGEATADAADRNELGLGNAATKNVGTTAGTVAAGDATALGLKVAEGANKKQGVATLVAGTVTVANTSVTATSRIFLTAQSLGTVAAPKAIGVTARTPGTSFTITSADATDTSVIGWEMFESAT